jgi:hypothetical protein
MGANVYWTAVDEASPFTMNSMDDVGFVSGIARSQA